MEILLGLSLNCDALWSGKFGNLPLKRPEVSGKISKSNHHLQTVPNNSTEHDYFVNPLQIEMNEMRSLFFQEFIF
jgi:hypothetical protein